MSGDALLQSESLQFTYEDSDHALNFDPLVFTRSERCALVGPSGSGKTTLAHLLTGILVPNSGGIVFDGQEISSLSEAERRRIRLQNIGLVFQEFELIESLSAGENILLPYLLDSGLVLSEAVRERAKQLATQLGIESLLGRKSRHLSQGERQRVAVGRALIAQPSLIIADEPTGNLDPQNAGRILDLLFDVAAEAKAALLVITHDHGLLNRFERTIDLSSQAQGAQQ